MTARVSMPGRRALCHVKRYEDGEYGVLLQTRVADKLLAAGLVQPANRRPYARDCDICVRLTDAGRDYLKEIGHG